MLKMAEIGSHHTKTVSGDKGKTFHRQIWKGECLHPPDEEEGSRVMFAAQSADRFDCDLTIESDYALARSASLGHIPSFEELYRRYNVRVYSLILRMTHNTTTAEDLTQEVFIQLHRKVGSFCGRSTFTTWLHRLTVNLVLMHLRKRVLRDELLTEDGEMPEMGGGGEAGTGMMPVLNRIALERAMAGLPQGYRTVFVLHDIEGYEHTEVARILGCSVGTSKSQLHKARLKMRKLLITGN